MLKFLIALVACMDIAGPCPAAASDKPQKFIWTRTNISSETVFVVWEYKNIGSPDMPFETLDPYCPEPGIRAPFEFAKLFPVHTTM